MNDLSLLSLGEKESCTQKIKALSQTEMEDLFHHSTFFKGHSYYYNNQIESIQFQPGRVIARIMGIKLYETVILRKEGKVSGLCNCPSEGKCKHLAALLIHLRNDAAEQELLMLDLETKGAAADDRSFEDYLNTLSVEELKRLVLQFAPESFRRSI